MVFLAILGLLGALVSCTDGAFTISSATNVFQQLYGLVLLLIGWVSLLIVAVASVGTTLKLAIRTEIQAAQKDNVDQWRTLFEVIRRIPTARAGVKAAEPPTPAEPPDEPPVEPVPPAVRLQPQPIRAAATPGLSVPMTASTAEHHRSSVGLAFLLLLIAAAVASAFFARDRIIALWPPAAQIYDRLGLKTGEL